MPFDPDPISDLRTFLDFGELLVSWASSAPSGSFYQVYVNRRLVWFGQARSCVLPIPAEWAWIDVGVVDAAEAAVDYGATLDPVPGGGNKPVLSWLGGTYEEPDSTDHFLVYGEATPGGGVDYDTPLAKVLAYPTGQLEDGFGIGGFGEGSFGRSAWSYTWMGSPRGPGTWTFAVVAYDQAGNASDTRTTTVAIVGPPLPPAPDSAGLRLTYTYNAGTGQATLAWNASPPF
jgi:hypothetical protein